MSGRWLHRLASALFLFITTFGMAALWAKWEYAKPGPLTAAIVIVVPKGSGSLAIGRQLRADNIVNSAVIFAAAAHLKRHATLKAGEYQFLPHEPLHDVVEALQAGHVVEHHLLIPEGLTNYQVAQLIEAEPFLSGAIGLLPAEGHLMPETYTFILGETRAGLVAHMHMAAEQMLNNAWATHDPALDLKNQDEALILASIVEKETGIAEERPKVAAVFLNRLRQGMKLQSDPTVIYALAEGQGPLDRSLTHADLAINSPYNTYEVAGLPPTPICNPGRAAVMAVMHPDMDNYLYFVATGSGGHAFADTLEEHNRNVADWLKFRHDHGQ